MSTAEAFLAFTVGVALTVAGLTWALGPWALVGCGVVLTVVALFVPVRERRGEPFDESVPTPK